MLQEAKHPYRVDEAPHEVRRWLCSIDDFLAMDAAGILHEDSRVELIDGELFQLAAKHVPHERWKHLLLRHFMLKMPEDLTVLSEPSIRLGNNVYEPDIVILPSVLWLGQSAGIPTFAGSELHLIVEVADASVAYDRRRKAAAYARDGVPQYWVLEARTPRLIVHRGPLAGDWREVRVLGPEEEVVPLGIEGATLRLSGLV